MFSCKSTLFSFLALNLNTSDLYWIHPGVSLCAEEHVRERQMKEFHDWVSCCYVSYNRCAPVGHSVTCCTQVSLSWHQSDLTRCLPVQACTTVKYTPAYRGDFTEHSPIKAFFFFFFLLNQYSPFLIVAVSLVAPRKKTPNILSALGRLRHINWLGGMSVKILHAYCFYSRGLCRIFAHVCETSNSASKFCTDLALWQILTDLYWKLFQGTISCL